MENDDTVTGGEGLSIEEAASAYAKTMTEEAGGQAEVEDEDLGEEADELQDSEEEAGEEEGDPDDEGQAEGEEDDEPETEQGRFVAANGRVRMPDGSTVTVSELIQGNLKERDYRQKTMGLAEERRQFQEQSSALQASARQIEQQQTYMVELLKSIIPPRPDPRTRPNPTTDPVEYMAYMEAEKQHTEWVAHLQYIEQQQNHFKEQSSKQTEQERLQKSNKEWTALQEAMPELRDQAKATTFINGLKAAGAALGFSPQEIAETLPFDHRMAIALHKAAQWDRLQASKPKAKEKVTNRPPIQKGGKRLAPDAQRAKASSDAINRLKQSGSVEDAAAAWLASQRR